jgi:hypothetical protein
LLLLPTPVLHDHILSANAGITMGCAKLHLLPWTRLAGAETIKLPFKIPLYIEDIPHHVRQPSVIRMLLPTDALFDCIDFKHRNDNEAQCCYITMWSHNPDNIVKEAALWLEEI